MYDFEADIGKNRESNQYIYCRCPNCKEKRWVDLFIYNKSKSKPDIPCAECHARKQGRINSQKRKQDSGNC